MKFLSLIQSNLRERYQKVLIDKINVYDGKIYKWGSSGLDFGSITLSYLYL
jgi:hypothetical protein